MNNNENTVNKDYAIGQVREMAYQFADMYFAFVSELIETLGEENAEKIITKVLYKRAKERALVMITKAEIENVERIPENIIKMTSVPFLGWVESLGCDHCPYGTAWNKRIKENPWFQKYASLYCDVTDTTIAEVFTGCYSHKITENVVLEDNSCERVYFLSDDVKNGKHTYDI